MKKIICLLTIILFLKNIYSQDTSIIKYLSFQVGNIWVYNWVTQVPPTNGKVKLKVTNTVTANGHIYYNFVQTGNTCSCGFQTGSPFLNALDPMRVDSNSGNFMQNGGSCLWYPNELLLDSLRKKIGDSLKPPCNSTICVDTSIMNVFGISRKTKSFTNNIMTYYSNRKYAKDIGLIHSAYGCPFNIHCDYDLQGCVINGVVYGDTTFPVGITKISSEIPEEFNLFQNYPNPFNPTTKIRFEIPLRRGLDGTDGDRQGVFLKVYDELGREIQTLVNENLSPGTYEIDWDGTNYPSGVYYYTISAGDYFETKKMVLLR